MLLAIEWLMLGALGSIAIFFFIFYFSKTDENYNLYFALGCVVAMIRMVSYAQVNSMDTVLPAYQTMVQIDHLTFIWGPLLYVFLADSFFPAIGIRFIRRSILAVALAISALIVFVPLDTFNYGAAYDYIILAFLLYAEAVFVMALVRRQPFAIPVFIANLVFMAGVTHDVLRGSHIISGSQGELFQYAFVGNAIVMAMVLAYRYMQLDKKRLQAQLKFLHAQIQPHFLYNTLGTISAYCKTDPGKAGELLEYLSVYLRGRFRDESDHLICLNDEIDLVKAYLTIEKTRFQERLHVDYDIQDGCNALIPSLILQPLVENAVKHGLLPRKEGGSIRITVLRQEKAVVITVSDNGVGMDAKTQARVLQGDSAGIGISNTNERLKRYYGTQLTIRSEPGEGCDVSMTIPFTGGDKG